MRKASDSKWRSKWQLAIEIGLEGRKIHFPCELAVAELPESFHAWVRFDQIESPELLLGFLTASEIEEGYFNPSTESNK